MRELIVGANFSGRSQMLRARVRQGETFLVGPYAEAALSGLSSTVADEIALYARLSSRAVFAPIDWRSLGARKPATLSGGEQVLLALHCFSRSDCRLIAVDTALEQLDPGNRRAALEYLGRQESFDVVLIDNRLDDVAGWVRDNATETSSDYACNLAAILPGLRPRQAPVIALRGLDFAYTSDRVIFHDVTLSLAPGGAYRLVGANGAGKTTLFKLLVGVLRPGRGTITLDGRPYDPWRSRNRVFALATQNPDHQWCGVTLAEDLARRRSALDNRAEAPSQALLDALARRLGVQAPDQHLYELPLAARKRLTWLWPLSGAMPWIMLDEPTIGQDGATRAGLAAAISRLCELGHGIVVVTHDDDFAALIPHRRLHIGDMTVRQD
jgi:energy-coupling factor transporter ATP-binding protein EcfA2